LAPIDWHKPLADIVPRLNYHLVIAAAEKIMTAYGGSIQWLSTDQLGVHIVLSFPKPTNSSG